jgi:threonine aldolase
MLQSIVTTTLQDDVMMEDPTTNSFEAYIAELTGHEASLLVMSGTMGNQVSLRTALGTPPYGVLADHRSHILTLEAGGPATLCGAFPVAVTPVNGHHLTLHDVQNYAVSWDPEVYDCPTRVISLENTLAGTIMPLVDARAISAWAHCQAPPIHMHLDGARLWEAVAANAGSLRDYCACFDSLTMCFTKGLGAPIGSVICSSKAFIKRARWIRKMLGGGIRAAGIVAAPARVAVNDVFLAGRLRAAQEGARRIADTWCRYGGRLKIPAETNMIWLDMVGVDKEQFYRLARERGLLLLRGVIDDRLVVHYQICEEAFVRMEQTMREVLAMRSVQQ